MNAFVSSCGLCAILLGLAEPPDVTVPDPPGGTVQGTVRIQTQLASVSRARGARYRTRGQTDSGTLEKKESPPEVTSVVVYLEELGGEKTYAPPSRPARLIQKNTQFVPRILPVVRGTKVEIVNKDDYYHNVFSNSEAKRFNIGRQLKDAAVVEMFETTAFIPIFCDIHLDMSAYVVVLDNPFFAQPSSDGTFHIPNVPPGRYRLLVWHERLVGQQKEITVTEGGTVAVDLVL